VPLRIIEKFAQEHPDSTFAHIWKRAARYESWTEDTGHLSPWVTWPTVHRGVTNEDHFIGNFGQDLSEADRAFPPLWTLLAKHNVRVGLCGSLHSYPPPVCCENYAFYLPDTFAAGSECFPKSLSRFQELNLRMARDSAANVADRIPWAAALDVLFHAPELGFKLKTFIDVGGQLLNERMKPLRKVRRRTYQAVLGFDVFMEQLRRTKPDFATFFTNHVASSMHRYWAAAFPADYAEFGYDDEWVATFRDEIDFTMVRTDAFLGRIAKFMARNPEYQLWLASSMGQAATHAQPVESQLIAVDPQRLFAALGMRADQWSTRAAMVPQVNIVVVPEAAGKLREALDRLYIAGEPCVYRECAGNFFSVDFGQVNLTRESNPLVFRGQPVDPGTFGLAMVERQDRAICTAYHIPNGSLLIYGGRKTGMEGAQVQISTRDIAPAILRNYGVKVPEYMTAAAIGA
jgi:hypothetical protein